MQDESSVVSCLAENWWEHCPCITRVFAKRNKKPVRDIIKRLDEIKEWGIGAIEIFAPYSGGVEYGGLDPMDYYSIDPQIGTMEDFLSLVEKSHQKGIAVIIFINVGYSSVYNTGFIKACEDIRQGIESSESGLFLWDSSGSRLFDRSIAASFGIAPEGRWYYSEKAQKYYWIKWGGVVEDVGLPQYDFSNTAWQKECGKIIKFWMDTGIDGMIIDAPIWYANFNWKINHDAITGIISSYPNKYIQPEGAGAMTDDPVLWIKKGEYNSVQDYGMSRNWERHGVIGAAIESGNPSSIEAVLRACRDRVVDAGGVTYLGSGWWRQLSVEQRLLEIVAISVIGEIYHDDDRLLDLDWSADYKGRLKEIIRACARYPALHAAENRIKLETGDDSKYYACIRTCRGSGQNVLAILNFQEDYREITVKLPPQKMKLTNLLTGEGLLCTAALKIGLQPYGYALYEIQYIDREVDERKDDYEYNFKG